MLSPEEQAEEARKMVGARAPSPSLGAPATAPRPALLPLNWGVAVVELTGNRHDKVKRMEAQFRESVAKIEDTTLCIGQVVAVAQAKDVADVISFLSLSLVGLVCWLGAPPSIPSVSLASDKNKTKWYVY
ncbi:hypothetical protein GUJ93_ZPchr0004g38323 [Zizania palustris]|uniref:Uncharacterized protein n=2 Tax=Zizania palustris TaxID=103762 RepID=A0A8J5SCM8_ZIZPA|nr:hypothetical protein GUJ93_ZPchr0004g38323 [Zizania palustris]